MNDVAAEDPLLQREVLLHALYEASELEHNLMCTYLYAAFSLKDGDEDGLSAEEAAAVKRWKQVLLGVAIEEMGHLVAVWNITSALGGSPRIGRANFPLDPGNLPASIVVKLAPFSEASSGVMPSSIWRVMFSSTTMASSTTKPVATVSAISDRLSRL